MLLFSDLHLSPKTFQTCMQVLRRVHKEALERQIPVGFLGDFFDRVYNEGTLPVNILNELLRFFELEWHVPMIMIPGNHDYFDASETEHGLTPFQYASKHIKVIDHPTVIKDQLWIPWRRDTEELKRIIDTYSSSKVIFGHFDIIGFKLNATRVSSEGLRPTMFPSDVPVYTGHYHTPQVYNNICYLGSPYQLSLSEAEDKKALLILDSHWHVCEKIPIDIGRKQYKWTVNELINRSSILKAEDRVSVTCPLTESITTLVDDLKQKGVDIQIKRPTSIISTRIEKQDKLTPLQLLDVYGRRNSIDMDSTAWKLIINWLKNHNDTHQKNIVHPVFPEKIEVTGFGPFDKTTILDTNGQGFTLITAECNETKGSSNGAGKSMITAGAWLWVCTGHIDSRGTLGFDSETSIIHDRLNKATVIASGTMLGHTWKIIRSLSILRQRKHTLQFFMNGENHSRSTIAATQKTICAELFGIQMSSSGLHNWLLQNCVWSQQNSLQWLDLSDSQAKQEIYSLANIDTWVLLFNWAKGGFRIVKDEVQQLNLEYTSKEIAYKALIDLNEKNKLLTEKWHEAQSLRIRSSQFEIEKLQRALEINQLPDLDNFEAEKQEYKDIRSKLEDSRLCIAGMRIKFEKLSTDLPEVWKHKDIQEEEEKFKKMKNPNVDESLIYKEQCLDEKRARSHQFEADKQNLKELKNKGMCLTCHRPFEKDDSYHKHLRSLHEKVETSRLLYASSNSNFVNAQQQHIYNAKHRDEYNKTMKYVQNTKSYHTIQKNLVLAEEIYDKLCIRLEQIEKKIFQYEQQKSLHQKTLQIRRRIVSSLKIMQEAHEEMLHRTCPYVVCENNFLDKKKDLDDMKTFIELKKEYKDDIEAILKWSGTRGIQTYAMEHTIQRLSTNITDWLRRFFGTDDICLKAYFDEKEKLKRFIHCPKHAGIMSGGQWRRVQLASFMAWREMSTTEFPLIVMDEACTHMDAKGIHDVQQTLRDWCEQNKARTCFFITHEPEKHRDTSVYQNHIKIIHKRGRSYITEENSSKRTKS